MNLEAAGIYAAAVNAQGSLITGLLEWAQMLEGSERAEAIFHINQIAKSFHGLTLAMADHNGTEL